MKAKYSLIALSIFVSSFAYAQKMSTRNGYVKFFSDAPVEDIAAENNQVSSIVNTENGQFAFLVPIKGFQFEKALMQEHFNENYMESGEYPNATFKGKIANLEEVDFSKEGTYSVQFEGTMNIHGIDQKMTHTGNLKVKEGEVSIKTKFNVKCSDYEINIPSAKKDNISDNIEVTVNIAYDSK